MSQFSPTRLKASVLFVLMTIFTVQFVDAQFTKLLDFTRTIDIQHPTYSQFVSDGTWLYGTAKEGGVNGVGALFRIKPDGTGYIKLKDFSNTPDGANPNGSLTLSGNVLYGMTLAGGVNNTGCIFKISTDGTGYSMLLSFSNLFDVSDTSKGRYPLGSLTLSGNELYGMTYEGGTSDQGCIFKVNIDGTGYTRLKDFGGYPDGQNPMGSLTLSGNMLYGMTTGGGVYDGGCIFSIHNYGSAFNILHNFSYNGSNHNGIPVDGLNPYGSLTLLNNELYGMTNLGGTHNAGCLFKINTDSTGYTDLLDFDGANGLEPTGSLIISDSTLFGMTPGGFGNIFKIGTDGKGYVNLSRLSPGSRPTGTPLLLNNVLYGMTDNGGSENLGRIFKVNVDGTAYKNLLDFGFAPNGAAPMGLAISGNVGYGVTRRGGAYSVGCIYKININGTGYTKLYDFSNTPNGSSPAGPLVLSGNVLYGTTYNGGINNLGCVFKINTDGTGYTTLFSFNNSNSGYHPAGTLVLSGSTLYGVTTFGDSAGLTGSTIFKINTDGSGYAKLFDFDKLVFSISPNIGLRLSGGVLYGTTMFGGTKGAGNIYKINTDGTAYTDLYDFDRDAGNAVYPIGIPVVMGNVLYGIASESILQQAATSAIYKINTDGNGFAVIKQFSHYDGIAAETLIAVGDTLYGTTRVGGSNESGTIFKINPQNNSFTKIWDFARGYPNNSDYSLLTSSSNVLYGTTWDDLLIKGSLFSYTTTATTKADPVITWSNPADISYGTLLGSMQLNATANVPGTFIYTPPADTKLEIGNDQPLKVDFIPTDTVSYDKVSKTVSINVTTVTGVGNLNDDNIRIFPNPFGDFVVIESTKSYAYISILDLSGKLIMEIAADTKLNIIPLKNLEVGTYMLVLKDNDHKTLAIKRIVKFR